MITLAKRVKLKKRLARVAKMIRRPQDELLWALLDDLLLQAQGDSDFRAQILEKIENF